MYSDESVAVKSVCETDGTVTTTPGSTCEHCEKPFQPRRADQRFCSTPCRTAFHNENRPAPRPRSKASHQASQSSPETLTASVPAPKDVQDFDWTDTDFLVCDEQEPIAAYRNANGDLVLRRKANWPHEEEDSIIIVAKRNIDSFVDRLTDALGFVGPA
jgi:hypothetical protein